MAIFRYWELSVEGKGSTVKLEVFVVASKKVY
jgi:hypothetical protein